MKNLYFCLFVSLFFILFSCDDAIEREQKIFNEDLSLVPEDNTIIGSWIFSESSSDQGVIEIKEKTTYIMPMRLIAMNKGWDINYSVNHQNMWDVFGCTSENRFIHVLNDCSISLDMEFEFLALSSNATITLMKGSSSISGDLFWKNNSIDNNTTKVDLTYNLIELKKGDLLYFTIKVNGAGNNSHKIQFLNSRIIASEI